MWKIIEEFPKYMINECGWVKNSDNLLMSPRINKNGYFTTIIFKFLLNIFILIDLSQNSIKTL